MDDSLYCVGDELLCDKEKELLCVNILFDGVIVFVINLYIGDVKNKKEFNIKICILVFFCLI